jgi:hypothetical protein
MCPESPFESCLKKGRRSAVVAETRGGTGGARHRRLTGLQINGNSDGRPPIELEVRGWRRRWRGDSGELL